MKNNRHLPHLLMQTLLYRGTLISLLCFAIGGAVPVLVTYIDRLGSRGSEHMLKNAFLFLCWIGLMLSVLAPFLITKTENLIDILDLSQKRRFFTRLMQLFLVAVACAVVYLTVYLISAVIFSYFLAAQGIRPIWISIQTPFFRCLIIALVNILIYVVISLLITTATRKKAIALPLGIGLMLLSLCAEMPLHHAALIPEGTQVIAGSALDRRLKLIGFLGRINPGSVSIKLSSETATPYFSFWKMLYPSLILLGVLLLAGAILCALQDRKKT